MAAVGGAARAAAVVVVDADAVHLIRIRTYNMNCGSWLVHRDLEMLFYYHYVMASAAAAAAAVAIGRRNSQHEQRPRNVVFV